jgi:hypothetical protein
MFDPLAGSIVIAIRRYEFVLIASDSFSTRNPGQNDYRRSIVNKIEIHPKLPVAVATAGLADLPIVNGASFEGQVGVREVVGNLFSACRYERHLKRENIEKEIRRRFLPQVQAVHNLESERPDLAGRGHLDIIVATYAERKTELTRFRLEDRVKILKDDGQLVCSGLAEEYYLPRVRNPNLYGDQFTSLPDIAAQVCRSVQEGIDFEAAHKAENERECGGPINLAIVDSNGARLLDAHVKSPPVAYNPDDPFFVAMHEAGHAVSAAVYGLPFTGVDVTLRRRDEGRTSAGMTHVVDLNPRDVVGKGEATLPRLIQCTAGPCAEELVNPHAFRACLRITI